MAATENLQENSSGEAPCSDKNCLICQPYKEKEKGELKKKPTIKAALNGREKISWAMPFGFYRFIVSSDNSPIVWDRIDSQDSSPMVSYTTIDIAVIKSNRRLVRHILKTSFPWYQQYLVYRALQTAVSYGNIEMINYFKELGVREDYTLPTFLPGTKQLDRFHWTSLYHTLYSDREFIRNSPHSQGTPLEVFEALEDTIGRSPHFDNEYINSLLEKEKEREEKLL